MSGSGGGGGAGKVDYPVHMEDAHADWLTNTGVDSMTSSIVDLMNTAQIGASPWAAQTPYDPDADIAAYEAAVTAFAATLAGIVPSVDWPALYTVSKGAILVAPTPAAILDLIVGDAVAVGDLSISDLTVVDAAIVLDLIIASISVADVSDTADVTGITEAEIVADVDAFADQLDDEITTKVLPRFRAGMRDINAVVSSAFPIGEAIIEAFRDREVAKHDSAIRLMAAGKNADIELENEKLHLRVKEINMGKDLEIAKANLTKDVEVGKTNLLKDMELSKTNVLKDTDVGKANLIKDAELARINIGKDVQISLADLTKNVDVGKVNILKDLQIEEITLRADIETTKSYLEGSNQLLRYMMQGIAWEENYTKIMVEAKRLKIVAKKEETDLTMEIDEKDALWDLEIYQYGGNLMASIGGGVGTTSAGKKVSTAQSAIGGALSGVAAGAMVGSAVPGIGTVVGAAGGALLGAASAFL